MKTIWEFVIIIAGVISVFFILSHLAIKFEEKRREKIYQENLKQEKERRK